MSETSLTKMPATMPHPLSRATSETSVTSSVFSLSSSLSRSSSSTSISEYHSSPKLLSEEPETTHSTEPDYTKPISKICFVGAGYVGGPTAAVIAFANPQIQVTVVDRDSRRIKSWQSKHLPIHEPGLNDIVRITRDGSRAAIITHGGNEKTATLPERVPNLFFSTECDEHIRVADIVFLSVNTPTKTAGIGAGAATNIAAFESAMRSIAMVAKPGAIIVEKSTVPCRTAEMVQDILSIYRPGVPFEILSNPEFLAEGTAIRDLLCPSRVLIGSSQTASGLAAASALAEVYGAWVPGTSIVTAHLWSSELAKLVANAMLAQRISSINTVSALCEKTGADVGDIARSMGLDPRIGGKFLNAGLGFGGSCFEKDILSLSYLAESLELPEVASYWRSVVDINEWQVERFVKRMVRCLNGSLAGKKITLLGYAFKKNTADTRKSRAVAVIAQLLPERPREIAIYDPYCRPEDVMNELNDMFNAGKGSTLPIHIYTEPYSACTGSSATCIVTEWDQFRYPPLPPAISSTSKAETAVTESFVRLFGTEVSPNDSAPHDEETSSFGSPFLPEPDCESGCDCCKVDSANIDSETQTSLPDGLVWKEVASRMVMPRWVFDGRGLVDPKGLEAMGFRVEIIGRRRD